MKAMLRLMLVGALCALFVFVPTAFADGKFYAPAGVNLRLPYQRALIAFNGREQLIVLESSVAGAGVRPVGWIVPVPALPDVGVLNSDVLAPIFLEFDRMSRPADYRGAVAAAMLLIAILFVMNGLHWLFTRKPMRLKVQLTVVAVLAILAVVALPSYQAVDVRHLGKAGDYDARVIRAADASELIGWLNANGFMHGDDDRSVFEGYIRRGWMFVVATVAQARDASKGIDVRATQPLVLQFPVAQPVYPLGLTSLAGNAVQFQLYVFAAGRMEGDGRFEVKFAKRLDGSYTSRLGSLLGKAAFAGNAAPRRFEDTFLTRLDANLTPERMHQDLTLRRAAADGEYRHKLFWGL
jgi:uncharacterized protein DUF2330